MRIYAERSDKMFDQHQSGQAFDFWAAAIKMRQRICRIQFCIKRRIPIFYLHALSAITLALTCPGAQAGEQSWTAAKTSTGISRSGHDVVVSYTPATSSPPSGAKITRVHASRSYNGAAQVQTKLCWNGVVRCVPITGHSLTTNAFGGLDAGKPIYLVHRVPGDTSLTPPLFVKGEVVIWFGP